MARSRPAHAVDDAWRERIKRAMEAKGWKRSDLARAVKCPPSTITELLNGQAHQSPYVPEIHAALDLTPPRPPIEDPDTEEMLALWDRLSAHSRARLLERGQMIAEMERATADDARDKKR
jgi:transcriptional regulator with XRE-family HTH domain